MTRASAGKLPEALVRVVTAIREAQSDVDVLDRWFEMLTLRTRLRSSVDPWPLVADRVVAALRTDDGIDHLRGVAWTVASGLTDG